MVDYEGMVKNETMQGVILYLVGRSDNGTSYPSIDRFFNINKATERYISYNIKLLHETKFLEDIGQILMPRVYGAGVQKGPNWKEPKFVTEKKYGIE
ncbi:hypothetical protein [Erwinia sp. SLM-02]|uniref:hypothetical protein n=1 Tax=Erwinia sp. SLM-02 TaxID=3020057 RepID=UPI0030810266